MYLMWGKQSDCDDPLLHPDLELGERLRFSQEGIIVLLGDGHVTVSPAP